MIPQVMLVVVVVVVVVSLLIFRGHSTREPAPCRVTYFILQAYTGTKKSGEVLEKMQVSGPEG